MSAMTNSNKGQSFQHNQHSSGQVRLRCARGTCCCGRSKGCEQKLCGMARLQSYTQFLWFT
eukprot:1741334-Pyramimonas_sp.AAC.1